MFHLVSVVWWIAQEAHVPFSSADRNIYSTILQNHIPHGNIHVYIYTHVHLGKVNRWDAKSNRYSTTQYAPIVKPLPVDVATQWPWKCHFQGPRFLFSRFWALDSSLLLWSFLAFPLVRSVCFVFSVCKRCHRTAFDVLLYFWTNFLTGSSVFSLLSNRLTCLIVATCALHPPFSFADFFMLSVLILNSWFLGFILLFELWNN